MTPPAEIFKAYDIRGTYPDQMDSDTAYQIGRAYARVLAGLAGKRASELRIGLGRDMREQAPEMAGGYRGGMMAEGATVVDAGMVATEMLYWLVGAHRLDGGAMCTASHNPRSYTGVKLVKDGAIALSGDEGIQDIRGLLDNGMGEAPGGGSVEDVDIYGDFQTAALDLIDPEEVEPRRVLADAAHGMAAPMVGPLLDKLGLDLVTSNWAADGEFPDIGPNPLLEENQREIIETARREKAELSIAWDGDADRCFFIDEDLEFVAGDFLTALLADSILRKEPGTTILYDVRASRAVRDTVEAAGGTAIMNRVGHSFIKKTMREKDGIFGGEVTGHYYFRENFYADNGFIPVLMLLELMSAKGQSLADLLAPLKAKYHISGEINTKVASMDVVNGKLAGLSAKYAGGTVAHIDGVSVEYPEWHFNVRPSNTEPLLRLNLEAKTPELMAEKRDEVLAYIRG